MHPYDSITRKQIEERGSRKWAEYPGAIGAWIAEMDFGIAPAIREALKVIDENQLYGYTPPALLKGLGEATSEFYASRYGWEFPAENVFPASDVLLGMGGFLDILAPRGAKIVVPTPAYMPFLTVPGAFFRDHVEVPQKIVDEPSPELLSTSADREDVPTPLAGRHWEMDFEAIDAALSTAGPDGGPGGVLVLCNPHNPTGRVYTRAELEKITEIVEKNGALVFSDEIHAPLTYSGFQHIPYASTSEAAARHTLTATSHTKSFNTPGLKCAQLIFTNDEHLAAWKKHGTQFSATAATPGVIAGITAYREGGEWLADTLGYLEQTRDFVADFAAAELPELGYIKPQGTYLSFFDANALVPRLPEGVSPQQFFLQEARVAMNDGATTGQAGKGWVRFNMGTPRPIVQEALEAMAAAIRKL